MLDYKDFRKIKNKYSGAFALVLVFSVLAQLYIQYFISQQQNKSKIINISGRQRMLSQRIVKLAYAAENSPTSESYLKLKTELDTFLNAHTALTMGSYELELKPPSSEEISKAYSKLDPYLQIYQTTVQCILTKCPQVADSYHQLQEASEVFLPLMNDIVDAEDKLLKKELVKLRILEFIIFAIILLIMLFELFIVLLPFNSRIIKQIQVQAEEQKNLSRLYHQAEMGELSASILHEVKNFLSVLDYSSKKLKKLTETDPAMKENIKTIDRVYNNVDKMKQVIRGMSLLNSNIKKEPVLIEKVIEDLKYMLSSTFTKSATNFLVEGETNLEIISYKTKLLQVLLNLVKNAVHATEGVSEAKVLLKIYKNSDGYFFEVADNGIGIPEEHKSKIMNSYFTTKAPGKGTGLGLSLSNRIAQELGGKLELIPTASPWSTIFRLQIPINAVG